MREVRTHFLPHFVDLSFAYTWKKGGREIIKMGNPRDRECTPLEAPRASCKEKKDSSAARVPIGCRVRLSDRFPKPINFRPTSVYESRSETYVASRVRSRNRVTCPRQLNEPRPPTIHIDRSSSRDLQPTRLHRPFPSGFATYGRTNAWYDSSETQL